MSLQPLQPVAPDRRTAEVSTPPLSDAPRAWARAYTLPSIPHLRLRCTLEAQRPARLNTQKGSMLRGALGHALRRLVCSQPAGTRCPSCALRLGCAYSRMYENRIEGEPPPLLGGSVSAPRPYVIEASDLRRDFATGEHFDFDLLLIGQATELQGQVLLAIDGMAQAGLGSQRWPFELHEVRWQDRDGHWQSGYQRRQRRWQPVVASTQPSSKAPSGPITLRFLTPCRLKVHSQVIERCHSFRTLAFKMLRRQLELAHFHCPSIEVDWTFRPYLDLADQIEIVAERLRWETWQRWSNRQQRHLSMGGFVGEIDLDGEIEPLWPMLRAAEVLHVGKSTAFGLGQVEVGR